MDAAGLELLRAMSEGWSDAFGDQVTKGERSVLDLASFHNFSTERYRYFENGTRVDDPAADSTRFTDQDEQFLLEPQAGDTLEFASAEAPRYVVGNDAEVSWAFQFPTPLQDASDSLTLFLGGAFELVYLGDGSLTLRALEDGTELASKTVTPSPGGLGTPSRPEVTFNWYAVGRVEVTIEYTDDDEQRHTDTATLTVDDGWLSESPVGRMGFRLDVSNPGIQLEAGSMAYIVLTSTTPVGRPKPHAFSSVELNQVPATGYGVVGALRIDPDRAEVFTTISEMTVSAEENVDVELAAKAVPPGETDADFLDPDADGTDEGPAYPRNNDPQNSVLQWTPNVSTFPTRTYSVDGSQIPHGRNVGAAVETAAGIGASTTKENQPFAKKRPIYPDDVVLLIGHTPDVDTATDINVFVATDQDW